ncbi:MAG: deoxyribonuclease IV [Pyrinomonadaceae bacterium MAG19_C2-C3]|nr:deoxyribonuclease IV [Pyrinomonadaceae bacterium MAG19_C2-C3]
MNQSFPSRFGFHAPIAGGLHNALIKSHELQCNAVQIFSRNPRGWTAKPLIDEEVARFQTTRAETNIATVVIHACYLANLAAADFVIREKSRLAFREEVERALKLEADYLVVHPGSAKGACAADGVRTCAETLRAACRDLELKNLRILIENTAGQGECIGHRFEHLRDIIALCPKLNLGVCFDTAHAFAAGYDLREEDGFHAMLEQLDLCVSTSNIPVVHFNDSKTAFASRVDRHANIGTGEIGDAAMRRIATSAKLKHAAFLLETPHEPHEDFVRDIAVLRSFIERTEAQRSRALRSLNGIKTSSANNLKH